MGKVNEWALEMPHLDRPLRPQWGQGEPEVVGAAGEMAKTGIMGRIWHAEDKPVPFASWGGAPGSPLGAGVSVGVTEAPPLRRIPKPRW